MKMIVATIRPARFADLKDALFHAGKGKMTVYHVSGWEDGKTFQGNYSGNSLEPNFVGKIRVEIAANDPDVQSIVELIRAEACTGNKGDGTISVYEIAQCIRIRTGEEGPTAI